MTIRRKLRLLLVDDHALVREGIRSSLVRYSALAVVGEAGNGKEAIRKSTELTPDIVLMDLNMPELSGLEAVPVIRKRCPKTKIIALTVHDTKEYVFQILRSGAHGYVLKTPRRRNWCARLNPFRAARHFSAPGSRTLFCKTS